MQPGDHTPNYTSLTDVTSLSDLGPFRGPWSKHQEPGSA
jgi:hypothetical protein